MAHVYTQMRDRVASNLGAIRTSLGPREVYTLRVYPKTSFPCVSVFTGNERLDVENPEYVNIGTKRYRRFLDITIEICVSSSDAAENELDALQLSVETLMANDDQMGGGVIATDLISVRRASVKADKPFVTTTLIYRVEFRTPANDAETFLN